MKDAGSGAPGSKRGRREQTERIGEGIPSKSERRRKEKAKKKKTVEESRLAVKKASRIQALNLGRESRKNQNSIGQGNSWGPAGGGSSYQFFLQRNDCSTRGRGDLPPSAEKNSWEGGGPVILMEQAKGRKAAITL